jgi:hypothetical protein
MSMATILPPAMAKLNTTRGCADAANSGGSLAGSERDSRHSSLPLAAHGAGAGRICALSVG